MATAIVGIAVSQAVLAADTPAPTVSSLLTQALPDIEGKEVSMLTVEYAPGGTSTAHRHNANTFVYVLEGSVVMQVANGKLQTLTVGQTFYESPTDIHTVSRNASITQKAKILVVFVKDKGAPASVPVN
jgi:quercetin dioxygenase-like cupin family protein